MVMRVDGKAACWMLSTCLLQETVSFRTRSDENWGKAACCLLLEDAVIE